MVVFAVDVAVLVAMIHVHDHTYACVADSHWVTVFTEKAGTGNGPQYDNSDIRTLNLVNPPFDVTKGNYRVLMKWGNGGYAQFTVCISLPITYLRGLCSINASRLTCAGSKRPEYFW